MNPLGDMTMRFMMLLKSDAKAEAGVLPSEKLLTEMGKYNEQRSCLLLFVGSFDGLLEGRKG